MVHDPGMLSARAFCFAVGMAEGSALTQTVLQPGETSQLKLAVHLWRIDGLRAIAVQWRAALRWVRVSLSISGG